MSKPVDKKLEKVAQKELYRMVKDGAITDIGGLDDDTTFYPEAYSSKWNGECWLKISHKDKEKIPKNKKAKTKIKDGKIEVEVDVEGTGRKHKIKEGSLEWDIEYTTEADLPVDNIERFTLEFPYDQLTWHHQSELTQKEIDDGHIRPENVVNSYAGYFDKANNEYETGKFCHIYRSKIIANDGAETWVNQEMVSNQLKINIPRQWCIDHGFPVILDPIVGFDGVGASNTLAINRTQYGMWLGVIPENGTLVSISIYDTDVSTNGIWSSGGVYEDDSGVPGALVALASFSDATDVSGWITKALGSGDLISGNGYWAGFAVAANSIWRFQYDSSGTTEGLAVLYTDSGTLQNPFGIPTTISGGRKYSAYLTYDPSGGSLLPINDTVTMSDSIFFQLTKPFSDTITLSDTPSKSIWMVKGDTISLSDGVFKAIGLVKSDTITMEDDFNAIITLILSLNDAISMSDAIIKEYSLDKADSVSMSDNFSNVTSFVRAFADTITMSDDLIKEISLALNDSVTMADDFNAIITLLLSLSDTITMSDGIVKHVGLSKSDTINLTDNASMISEFFRTFSDNITMSDEIFKTFGLTEADIITMADEFGTSEVTIYALLNFIAKNKTFNFVAKNTTFNFNAKPRG